MRFIDIFVYLQLFCEFQALWDKNIVKRIKNKAEVDWLSILLLKSALLGFKNKDIILKN